MMMGSKVMVVMLMVGISMAGEPIKSSSTPPSLDLMMPGAKPSRNDDYLCSSFDVMELSQAADNKSELHVTGFVPTADANKAHHMLLYSCDAPMQPPGQVYDCLHHGLCKGGQSIMFAWAKNAPPTTLPPEVSFSLDPKVRRYLVLQVHYAHQITEPDYTSLSLTYQESPTKYSAGILLMLRSYLNIPANTPVTHGDVNCKLPSNVPLHLFAYRTHAHSLSPVITGYVYNEEGHQYREIARGSPQWPQAFYPMKKVQTVYPKDIITARCTYNSTGVNHATNIGSTAGDEMCNLYIMFFAEPGKVSDYLSCVNEMEGESITRGLPADSDKVPDKRPEMEAHAHDINAAGGPEEINYAKLFEEEQKSSTSKKKGGLDDPETTTFRFAMMNLTMPGVRPQKADDYICTGFRVKDMAPTKIWATSFEAISTGNRAHHMIISRCKAPVKTQYMATWDCAHHAMCQDSSKIMFAWAKHAQPTKLPEDVGFELAPDDYIVLQVHYAKPLCEEDHSGISVKMVDSAPKYTAGMFLLLRSHLDIPPETEATHGDVNCQAKIKSPVHVFAYRTHAHSLGSVISGYRYSPATKQWRMLAKGNPQWPQAFYPMENVEIINPGEILAARCTYDSRGHNSMTRIGHTGGDEMCNLYLMFYTLSSQDDFVVCVDEQNSALTAKLPPGNDTPLPRNPELEHVASGHVESGPVECQQSYDNGNTGPMEVPKKKQDPSVKKRPGADIGDYNDSFKSSTNIDNFGDGIDIDDNDDTTIASDKGSGMQPRSAYYNPGYQPQYPVPYYQQQPQYQPQYQYGVVAEAEPNSYNVDIDENSDIGDGGELMEKRGPIGDKKSPKSLPGSDLSVVANWPTKETADQLGQISGVAVDIYGNAIIFHRGDRTWNGATFRGDNTYGLDKNVPIPQDTIFTVNSTGHIVNAWGRNMFFLPHMITVDSKNNIWLTDVALHQVFKFAPYGGNHQPQIVLGEKFVPGADDSHYCKPTSVAVSEDTNSFFVSDGYCNSRIIKYGVKVGANGKHDVKKLFEWGKGAGPFTVTKGPNSFNIPHGLALAEDRNEICVADRENGRVQCFTLDGDFTRSIQPEEFGSRIFSVAYTKAKGGQLHAVSGPEFSLNPWSKKPTGYIIDMDSGELEGTWNVPGGLSNPHDVAVSQDGNIVYVVELNPFKVWKLTNGSPSQTSAFVPPSSNPPPNQVSQQSSLSQGLEKIVPADMNSSVLVAAAVSVPLSIIIALCLACRRCRKRGKGTMISGGGGKGKNWNVGDILGRSKEGFKPLNTDEGEGMLDDDSDSEVEEFSLPANHA